MSKGIKVAVFGLSVLSACFAAQALLLPNGEQAATPEQVRALTQSLAACPELLPQAASAMDNNFGFLNQNQAGELFAQARRCQEHHATEPEPARYAMAYSALKNLIVAHAAD